MARKFLEMPRPERFMFIAAVLVVAGPLSIIASVCVYIYFFHGQPIGETGDWGEFGAYISGVAGTTLSAFTLAALAFTLGLQATELAETRALANKQSKILETQSATMAQEAFDSVFFNLLDRFSEVRDSVTYGYERPRGMGLGYEWTIAKGREALEFMYDDFSKAMRGVPASPNRLGYIKDYFEKFYQKHESELGPYFRTLYHTFKFLHHGPQLTDQQRIDYANIARAQLSGIELCIIFYDGLTDLGTKFKPLIQDYGILKHVNDKKLMLPSDKTEESLYERRAFQSQEEREGRAAG